MRVRLFGQHTQATPGEHIAKTGLPVVWNVTSFRQLRDVWAL